MVNITHHGLPTPPIYNVMHVASVFIFVLNCFSIYVIARHTPPQMKTYSRYLLLYQAITVITDESVLFISTPFLTFPAAGGLSLGLLSTFGVSSEVQLVYGTQLIILIVTSMIELFFQRQQTIVPDGHFLRLERKWSIYTWNFCECCAPVIVFIYMTTILENNECNTEGLKKKFPFLEPIINHPDYMCLSEFNVHICYYFVAAILVSIVFLLGTFVTTSIYFLYAINIHISHRTRDIQKKMFFALTVQTIVPFTSLLLPVCVSFYIAVNERIDLIEWNPYIIFCFSLHGPCSTVLILCLYAPYFEYIKKLFHRSTRVFRSPQPAHLVQVIVMDSVSTHLCLRNGTERSSEEKKETANYWSMKS